MLPDVFSGLIPSDVPEINFYGDGRFSRAALGNLDLCFVH